MTALAPRPRKLAMIAALTHKRVIGQGPKIPWHYPEDMAHFRAVTAGHAVIMGRATFMSIGKPLKGRRNIIVSHDRKLKIEGADVVHDLDKAITLGYTTDPEPMILGGAQIYEAAMPIATRMYLTYVQEDHEGDVFFPEHNLDEWIETERREGEGLTFVTLDRKPG